MSDTLPTNRFEAFSDGVFAIAITLLVLQVSVPEGSGADLLGAIVGQWPTYLAYLVSFATIGATWLEHAAISRHLQWVDSTLVRINLLLLLLVSLLPFPTGLVGDYVEDRGAERVASTMLGINLLLVGVVVLVLWRYAHGHGLIRPDTEEEAIKMLTRRFTPRVASYVVLILLALSLPRLAVIGYAVIALLLLVPIRSGRSLGQT